MKQITTLTQLVEIIERKENVFQDVGGKKYELNFILILQKPLIELMSSVRDGLLFYNPEY
jgi:hypothetical protein